MQEKIRDRLSNIKININIPQSSLKAYILWIFIIELTGTGIALLTVKGMMAYINDTYKPPLSPHPALFPIAWIIIYALMAIGITRIVIVGNSTDMMLSLVLFIIQFIFNIAWYIIFFNMHKYGLSLFWIFTLLILVMMMTISYDSIDKLACVLQLPYIIWLMYTTYLNAGIWLLNS